MEHFLEVLAAKNKLYHHPVYEKLNSIHNIRIFMEIHVFAVWDFMSILKSLQQKVTCVEIPWKPSKYPAPMGQLINQIVLGEESDLDDDNQATSHFELYLRAMKEVGASTHMIESFLKSDHIKDIPAVAQEFVSSNLNLARHGSLSELAAHFFFGREKIIPDMFSSMIKVIEENNIHAPTFAYYLKRHIQIDGEEHGPLALKFLKLLTGDDLNKIQEVRESALKAIELRSRLWDEINHILQ